MNARSLAAGRTATDRADGRPSEAAVRVQGAARQLFYERGYLATSIRDLASACGVTPGAIYNHFASKHDLLYSIIRSTHEVLDQRLFNAVTSAGPAPHDQLRSLVTSFVEYNCLHPEEARVTNREYVQLPVELLNSVLVMRRRIRSMFVNVLVRGQELGEFEIAGGRTSPVAVVAMAIINMCILAAEWYDPAGPLPVDAVAAVHAGMAVRMVSRRVSGE